MENLLEKITINEWEMIDSYRRSYVDVNCSDPMAPSKKVLGVWEKEKQDLYKVLGDNLMVSKEFSYAKSEDLMKRELEAYLEGWESCGREGRTGKKFWMAFWDWRTQNFPTNDLIIFDSSKKVDEEVSEANIRLRQRLECLCSMRSLVRNKYEGSDFSIPLPNGKELKVNTGSKVMKTLAKIADIFNLPGFEDFRICQSYVTNSKILKGNLTLSIHPLDYMTMSDNRCDWDSCMSWENEGCYRQGTVEMMNSPCVVVAYLTADKIMPINLVGEWTNKKWRQLFIVNKDLVFGIKSYPYSNDEITEYALNMLKDLAEKNMGWTYGQEEPVHWSYGDILTAAESPFTFEFYTELMYNDVGSINYHSMYYNDTDEKPNICKINYSGSSECMWCGSLSNLREDSLSCDVCDHVQICADCGDRLDDDEDEIYYLNGNAFCAECYSQYVDCCELCDDEVLIEEIKYVGIYLDNPEDEDEVFLFGNFMPMCPDCFAGWGAKNLKDITSAQILEQKTYDDKQRYFLNIDDIKYDGIQELLPSYLEKIYFECYLQKGPREFIKKVKERLYYGHSIDEKANYTLVSYKEACDTTNGI